MTSLENIFTRLYTPLGELALSRFKEPTPIQEKVIPLVLKGNNVLAIASTGVGKTESCMLPIFSKLKEKQHKSIAALYITPMKSLNRDLQDRLIWWCNKLDLDISIRHGDTTQHERKLQLEYPPQILVTTPEQIGAMLVGKKFREHLRNIKYIVIDECIPGDTEITLSNGNKISIKRLVEKSLRNNALSCQPKENYYVKALDMKTKKIVNRKVEHVHKILLNKKMYYLRTKFCNLEISATADHKFAVKSGNRLIWKEIKNLKSGDKLIINICNQSRTLKVKNNKNKKIINETQFIKTYYNLFGRLKGKTKKIRNTKLKHIIKNLQRAELLPLISNNPNTEILAKIAGHIFGDGWITVTKNTKCVGFSACLDDLLLIEKDLNVLGFKSGTKIIRKTTSQVTDSSGTHAISGTSCQMSNGSKSLVALLISLGIPYGKKTNQEYDIPKWIKHGNKNIKRTFLSAFMGAEFPKFKSRKHLDFDAIRFEIYKREDMVKNGVVFVNNMVRLLNEFDVKTSKIKIKNGNTRKDGTKTKIILITVSNSGKNIINLIKNIGISYHSEKNIFYEMFLEYLLCKEYARKNKNLFKHKINVMKLRGYNYSKISEKIGLDKQMNYNVNKCRDFIRSWLKYKNSILRGFPDFKKWRKKYYFNGLFLDEITVIKCKDAKKIKYVYDLTVEEDHNFIANDIIVHNCHEIIQSKRGVQLSIALERLKELCGEPQTIALSATVGSPELVAKFIFNENDYEIIKTESVKDLEIVVDYPSPNEDDKKVAERIFIGDTVAARLRAMRHIIKAHKSSLIFTNTREAAEILSSRLRLYDQELTHDIHHSSLSKDVRIKAEKGFKDETLKTLICTSSLELGIDIGSIDAVVQYMSPRQVSKLVQRFGRSGHGVGRKSKGFIICAEGDDIFESSVIARRCLHGELEKMKIHTNSTDVLAHQIIGMLMVDYEIKIKEAYRIVKKAYPFASLSEKEFESVVNILEQLRLLYRDKDRIARKRKAFEYYFENLSVIPDNRSYKIIELGTNSFIGNLDEEFVINNGSTGSTFIVKGSSWKIISVENGKVYVEAVNTIESAVPAWNGELIPVPYDIAKEVGELREQIAKLLDKTEKSEIIKKLQEKYPISNETAKAMISTISEQLKKHQIPTHKEMILETYKDYVVIHSLNGTLVNETLSRFISAVLSAEYGEAIFSKCDPYRIIFRGCGAEDIKKVLTDYKSDDVDIMLQKALPRSSLFKWRFLRIAKRFGVIERNAVFDKINIERIIDAYWNSPIHEEAFKEIFIEKLDVETTKSVMDKIRSKEIKITSCDGLSPLAEAGFKFELSNVVRPLKPEKEIFKLFKDRLMKTKIRMICINCGKYSFSQPVCDIKDPICPKCGSRLLALVRDYEREVQIIVKKWLTGKDLTEVEQKKLEYVKKSADLTIVYGAKAAFVIAGRGVGPATAFRILSKPNLSEEQLLKNILTEERAYIANKKYWTN